MSNVHQFTGVTKLDLPPDQVLEQAMGKLETVLIIGYDKEGEEYFASSVADGGTALWLSKKFEKALLSVMED